MKKSKKLNTRHRNQKIDKIPITTNLQNVPTENYFWKNIFALMLIIIMPNFVMVLTYIVQHCHSSFIEFFSKFQHNSIMEIFQQIWLKDELDFQFGISVIFAYSCFALFIMIIIPGKISAGSITPSGSQPLYTDNGFYCYIFTMLSFGLLELYLSKYTSFSVSVIYLKFPSILACLSIFSLGFCFLLYIKGLYFPTCPDKSLSGYFFFDYYWGVELHPRIKGIDFKVFTNCRFGLTVWAILILCYLKYSQEVGTINYGLVVNVVLQLLYLTKFFWWEAGYYNTMDINVDHAGFYICWGCIVYVPSMYTLSSYHMTTHSNSMSDMYYIAIFIIGLLSLIINYWADYQKQIIRLSKGKCSIWNKPAKVIEAEYFDLNGSRKKNILLVSGFWGLARHFHYLPELLLSFCWCASSGFHYLIPFSYFIFLTILLLHRVERDDIKCKIKYGKYYEQYKSFVPWKIIPYIY